MAQETIEMSKDLLTIDVNLIEKVLVDELLTFQKKAGDNSDAFAKNDLNLKTELGLQVFFNIVNFCFKDPLTGKEYRYISQNGNIIKRSTGLFSALAESDIDWNNLDEVSNISQENWKKLAQLNKGNNLYLSEERGERLRNFARYLISKGYRTIQMFLESTAYDTVLILQNLIDSGYFKDEFLKRAQVTVRRIDNILKRRGEGKIESVETLTCMADYRIPQVFYNLGVVKLNSDLSRKLEAEKQIGSNSREELALRAAVVTIGKRLAETLNIFEFEVDGLLWNMSQKMMKEGKLTTPHMIVATDKY